MLENRTRNRKYHEKLQLWSEARRCSLAGCHTLHWAATIGCADASWWAASGAAVAETGWDEQSGWQLHGSPGALLLWNRQTLCWVDKWKSSLEDNRYAPAVCTVLQESWEQTGRGLEGSNVNRLMTRKYDHRGKLNKLGLFSIKNWKWVVWWYCCSKEENTLLSVFLIERSSIVTRKIEVGCKKEAS